MKILYLTSPNFFDLEISYIRELSKLADVRVLLYVAPMNLKSSAFSLDSQLKKEEIIIATEYPGMEKYDGMIDRKQWFIVNDYTNFSLGSCYRLNKKMIRFMEAYNPDIVHLVGTGKQKSMLAAMMDGRRKMLLSVHDVIEHGNNESFKIQLLYKVRNFVIKKMHNILLYSYISDDILKKQLNNIPHTIYHSTLGAYDFLNSYPLISNQYGKYVLFFGRIDYYKGVDILVESYLKSNLPKQGIRLLLAGKDNVGIVKNMDNENVIILNRYIENDELANLIRNSMFAVLPYRTATQSGVTKSAFALGKPMLCTDAGNLPIEVIDGKYGKIVRADDSSHLTEGLNWMVSNTDILEVYADNIKTDWNEDGQYSWKCIAKDMIANVYEKIIENNLYGAN
ncbi:Glycosyltransferase involved in cell wall bisynthesis [Bacteroides faecichinchillae]|uniref:Glycosyltransferase involved in cell wall bisynthesis n=2 Tax=Bacteroides faecichinchillae TaxID=871325 RepID=A0A1M5FVT1_9BACE|nr:glycosyltransferase [Bacteroides faecichinchillae]THG59873.1 glycosyltransferase [Bacteroides faecichinchillae]SHF95549.1 Glycosyltransferase involved in cell wall bisynthesis [Bacteroides faecichinchillae]